MIRRALHASVLAAAALGCGRESVEAVERPYPRPAQDLAVQGSVVPTGTTATVVLEHALASDASAAGDRFRVRFLTPLRTDAGGVAVPEGAYAWGSVVSVRAPEPPEEPSLTVRFDRIVSPDGREVPFDARILSAAPKASIVAGRPPVTEATELRRYREEDAEEAIGGGPPADVPITLPVGTEIDLILMQPLTVP